MTFTSDDYSLITELLTERIDCVADLLVFSNTTESTTKKLTALVKARRNLRYVYQEQLRSE
jgi:hypothetical protein